MVHIIVTDNGLLISTRCILSKLSFYSSMILCRITFSCVKKTVAISHFLQSYSTFLMFNCY